MDKISVQHIISQLKKGDKSEFIKLVNAHKNMVYGLSLKMTQSAEDAEEITQDTFVKVYQSIHSFKAKSKLSTWIYQITYYTTLNYIRSRKNRIEDEITENNVEREQNSLDTLELTEQKKFIEVALKELTPQERAVITFFYLEGYSINEIAQICCLSRANTKIKIHRSRAKMKATLSKLLAQEVKTLY